MNTLKLTSFVLFRTYILSARSLQLTPHLSKLTVNGQLGSLLEFYLKRVELIRHNSLLLEIVMLSFK